MRVLFYLEAHPIRDSFTNFSWLKGRLLQLCSSVNKENFKIFSNEQSLDLLEEYNCLFADYLIHPESKDSDHINSYMKEWSQDQGIKTWKELMHGEGEVSEFFMGLLKKVKATKFDFDIIVHWSINGAVLKFARENDVVPVTMELGFLRHPFMSSIMFDDGGIIDSRNYKLSIEDLYDCGLKGISTSEAQILFSGKNENLNILHEKKYLVEDLDLQKIVEKKVNRKVALIPIQLEDDSNIVNSRFKSVTGFLEEVVPKLIKNNFYCIIKTHPKYVNSDINIESCKESQDFYSSLSSDHVMWLDKEITKGDYIRMLNMVDSVITVNSSVGFESVLFDKEVAVLGQAPYKVNNVFLSVDEITTSKYDKDKYLKDLAVLREYFLHFYLVNDEDAFIGCFFFERIRSIAYLYKASKDNKEWLGIVKSIFIDRDKVLRKMCLSTKIYKKNPISVYFKDSKSCLHKIVSFQIFNRLHVQAVIRNKSSMLPYILKNFSRSFSTKIYKNYNLEIWLKKTAEKT